MSNEKSSLACSTCGAPWHGNTPCLDMLAPVGTQVTISGDSTYRYLAQRVIAVCAAYVDRRYDPAKTPAIDTDAMIAEVCHYFGIAGREQREVYEMREGSLDNPAFFK